MAKMEVTRGTTSYIARVFAQDTSKTDGSGLTGLVFNSASLSAYYIRQGDATATAIALVTATIGTFTSSGFKEVDAANLPGVYEMGIPNAALSSGVSVLVMLKGAANMAPVLLEIEVDAWNNQDAVRGGLSALPNAAAGAAGGVPTGDASGHVTITTADHTAIGTTDVPAGLVAGHLTTARADKLDNLDQAVGSRMATFTYTAPDNADIVTALADLVTLLARTDPTTALGTLQTAAAAILTGQAALATPAQVATALVNAGVSVALMEQLSALNGSSVLAGNVETCTSLDGLHVYTLTYHPAADDTCTSVTIARIS